MIVHKFGGASVKDAVSVKRMAELCKKEVQNGIIVVSAMGKTTNLLEQLTKAYFQGELISPFFNRFVDEHHTIISDLFGSGHAVNQEFDALILKLKEKLNQKPGLNYDFEYDQIVSFGELVSTRIVANYLNQNGLPVIWKDIRKCLKTDSTFREGKINWELSSKLVQNEFDQVQNIIYLTQGFIGADPTNLTTTLGREGSDFTASILANILNAGRVVVWKDVPGILCADPDWLPDAPMLDHLSYHEAIELSFFGAKVIHPKTIKPLQNKDIPLQVRSFLDGNQPGTLIGNFDTTDIPPVYILKEQQILISIQPKDFSFIIEENLSHIFGVFARYQIKVNLMQNSAISFSVSVDGESDRVKAAIKELKEQYIVKYNDNLELITIRHIKPGAETMILSGRTVLVEQRSRSVARYVVRK